MAVLFLRGSDPWFLSFAQQKDTVRNVKQFQFYGWPEHSVPKTGEGVIDLIGQVQRVYEQQEEEGPITVHCR